MKWLYNMEGTGLSQAAMDESLVLNRPKASPWQTVEELEAKGLVGIYEVNPNIGSMTVVVYALVVAVLAGLGMALLIRTLLGL